jgi:HlyD family secretion protein
MQHFRSARGPYERARVGFGTGPVAREEVIRQARRAHRTKGRNMRRVVWGGAVAAVALVAVGLIVRHGSAQAEQYRFVSIERGDVASTVSATGTLDPVRTVQVGTQVSGQISALYADYNSHVKKGELIAQLDPTLLQEAVTGAQADEEKAKADLDEDKFLLEQSDSLFKKNVVTESDYRSALHAWQVADAANTSAQAALYRARQNLRYANVYAPIDGIVIERNVQVGQTVAASFSAPQLFLIAQDLTQMQILAQVDESDIGRIHDGEPVSFTVEAYPNRTFQGTVSQVRLEPTTSDNVVEYTVVVDVNNKDGKLLPGMTATVTFLVNKADNVLEVPNAAVRFRPSQQMIAEVGGAARDSTGGRGGRRRFARAAGRTADLAGGFGFSGPPEASPWAAGADTHSATLWYFDAAGKLHTSRVKTGLSNDEVTQVSGPGLHAGMQIVAGVITPDQTQQSSSPFGGGRGGFRFGF